MRDAEVAAGFQRGNMHALPGRKAEIDRMAKGRIARRHRRPARPQKAVWTRGQNAEQQAKRCADADAARAVDRVDGHVEITALVQGNDGLGLFGQDAAHASCAQRRKHVMMGGQIQRLLPVAAVIGPHHGFGVAMQTPRREPRGQGRHGAGDGRDDGACGGALKRLGQAGAGRGPVDWKSQHQALLYLASTASMASTLPADLPEASKLSVSVSQASAMALASSGPITRAPIVMICALFDSAARVAE